MRIVDISAYFVDRPRSGGQVRIHCLNRSITRDPKVSAEQFSFTPVLCSKRRVRHDKRYYESINNPLAYIAAVVLLKWIGIRSYDFIIPTTFRFVPMPRGLKDAIARSDVVMVEHPWLFSWVKRNMDRIRAKKPVVLAAHNVESELYPSMIKKHPLRRLALRAVRLIEREAVQDADAILSVCQEDKDALIKNHGAISRKVSVVPNGASKGCQPFEDKKNAGSANISKLFVVSKTAPVVLFVGSNHPPNDEAVRFIEDSLAKRMSKVSFVIVGGVRKEGRSGNVVYTGEVEEIEPYYAAADVAINPMMSGSGSNLKMFAYFFRGLPVLATRKGARGIEGTPGEDYIVSSAADFRKDLATLIKDSGLRSRIGLRGKRLAEKYDWSRIGEDMLRKLRKIAEASKR